MRRLVIVILFSLTFGNVHAQRTFDTDILRDTFGYTDETVHSVPLSDLQQGCARRDCIVSIDSPQYVTASEASHVADDDIVLALSFEGYHRAWPARILDQHEIVNDIIAGELIAITWCPLCGSAVGVKREINGYVTEFGVSGLLYNSDLVLYDRRTETLWDQIGAQGIVGPLTGTRLELVPVTMTRWGRWKAAHPDTLVLSEDTGFMNDYSQDAYANYRDSERLMFPVSRNSDRLHPKTVVFGFDVDGEKLAVAESAFDEDQAVSGNVSGRLVSISMAADGAVSLRDEETDATYAPVRLYWFAWYTFHPDTGLIR